MERHWKPMPLASHNQSLSLRKALISSVFSLIIGITALTGIPTKAVAQDVNCYYTMCLWAWIYQVPPFVPKGGPGCLPYITSYFAIQIWDPHFDAGATAVAREAFLTGICPTQIILNGQITLAVGFLPIMPP